MSGNYPDGADHDLRAPYNKRDEAPEPAPGYRERFPDLPRHTMDALTRYERDRVPPGGFLRALLEGNLFRAVNAADSENAEAFTEIARMVWRELRCSCYGTPAIVAAWLAPRTMATEAGIVERMERPQDFATPADLTS
jgi:hypothetical protein